MLGNGRVKSGVKVIICGEVGSNLALYTVCTSISMLTVGIIIVVTDE